MNLQNPPTSPHCFLNPEGWVPAKGYANGMLAEGKVVYTGGLIGWNGQQQSGAEGGPSHRGTCISGPVARNACAARTVALVLAVKDPLTVASAS